MCVIVQDQRKDHDDPGRVRGVHAPAQDLRPLPLRLRPLSSAGRARQPRGGRRPRPVAVPGAGRAAAGRALRAQAAVAQGELQGGRAAVAGRRLHVLRRRGRAGQETRGGRQGGGQGSGAGGQAGRQDQGQAGQAQEESGRPGAGHVAHTRVSFCSEYYFSFRLSTIVL